MTLNDIFKMMKTGVCDGDTETSATLNALINRSITGIKSDVEKVGNAAFQSCSLLTTIDFPVATYIGAEAFQGCVQLTTVDFPVATSIGNHAFYGCAQLTTADFPVATSIGDNGFRGCSLLTADFPVATSIGAEAFRGCTQLTTADFPVATSIGDNGFYGCLQLSALTLRAEKLCSLRAANALGSTSIASGTGYVYVPSALVDSYKSATNWSTYANQFRALEDYTVDGTTTGELDTNKTGV